MEHRSSASQAIHRILWDPKFYYFVHKIPPFVRVLSQINPVHTVPDNLFKIHRTIMLPLTYRSSKWTLSVRFPHQNSLCTSPLTHMCNLSNKFRPSFNQPANILWWVQSMNLDRNAAQFLRVFPYLIPLLHHPILENPQPTLFTQCGRPSITPI